MKLLTLPLALLTTSLSLAPALASSDDAWAGFAKDVKAKCLAAAAGSLTKPKAIVDPFGSQSYGLALLTGQATGTKTTVSFLCAYDKKSKKAEIGSELGADVLKLGK